MRSDMIQKNIRKLVQYGLQTGLITEADKIYTTNRLLELFHLDEPEDGEEEPGMSVDELEEVLSAMMDYAYEQGIMTENSIVYRDLFDTKIMSMLVPRPSEVIAEFEANMQDQEGYQDVVVKSEILATQADYFTLKLICYQGAGSGYQWNYYYTIDLNTGERLQLKDLFQDGADYITPISESIKNL